MTLWIDESGFDFDAQTMCVERNEYVYAFKMSLAEGQAAEFEYDRPNRGLSSVLTNAFQRRVHVAWSPTGRAVDAIHLATGYVTESPGDLLAETTSVRCRCAPADIDARILAWAKANLMDGPHTDLRFSDDPEAVDTYIVGRCVDYHVHPVTHAISVSDTLIGDRVVDLTEHLIAESGITASAGSFGEPLPSISLEFDAAWTQEAQGVVDIAPQISAFETFDSDPMSILQSPITRREVDGIDLVNGGIRASITHFHSYSFDLQGYEAVYETQVLSEKLVDSEEVAVGTGNGGTAYQYKFGKKPSWETLSLDTFSDDPSAIPDDEGVDVQNSEIRKPCGVRVFYEIIKVKVLDYNVSWQVSQGRSEKMMATLILPVPSAPREKPEVMTASLRDDHLEPPAPTYDPSKAYVAGDVVTSGVRRYRATRDIPAGQQVLLLKNGWTRYTESEDRMSIVRSANAHEFQQHILCRLLREGRRRLRSVNLQFDVPFEVGIGLTTRDSASIVVPWTETEDRLVTGKVISVELSMDGDKADCTVTLGICMYGSHGGPPGGLDDVQYDPIVPIDLDQGTDPLTKRIKLLRAGDARGILVSGSVENTELQQLAEMDRLAGIGADPALASVRLPTRLVLDFEPLGSEDEIHNDYELRAVLQDAPRGYA